MNRPESGREQSVTVGAAACIDADAAATAVFGATRQQAGASLAAAVPGTTLVHST